MLKLFSSSSSSSSIRTSSEEEEEGNDTIINPTIKSQLTTSSSSSSTTTTTTPISSNNYYYPIQHHTAIRTRNITTAIDFYSTVLDLHVETKFRTGPARAAWLQSNNVNNTSGQQQRQHQRIELIEVPLYMLNEIPGVTRARAVDVFEHQSILGYNHIAFDVSNVKPQLTTTTSTNYNTTVSSLQQWLDLVNYTSIQKFNKSIRLALQPKQQLIGQNVYEIAFIYDPDGCLIELLYYQRTVSQIVDSGWEPLLLSINNTKNGIYTTTTST